MQQFETWELSKYDNIHVILQRWRPQVNHSRLSCPQNADLFSRWAIVQTKQTNDTGIQYTKPLHDQIDLEIKLKYPQTQPLENKKPVEP